MPRRIAIWIAGVLLTGTAGSLPHSFAAGMMPHLAGHEAPRPRLDRPAPPNSRRQRLALPDPRLERPYNWRQGSSARPGAPSVENPGPAQATESAASPTKAAPETPPLEQPSESKKPPESRKGDEDSADNRRIDCRFFSDDEAREACVTQAKFEKWVKRLSLAAPVVAGVVAWLRRRRLENASLPSTISAMRSAIRTLLSDIREARESIRQEFLRLRR